MSRRGGGYSPSSPGLPRFDDQDGYEDDDPLTEHEEDGEDLVNTNMRDDYRRDAVLDAYDEHDLASDEDVELDYEAREAAERELRRREMQASRARGRQANALFESYQDDEDGVFDDAPVRRTFDLHSMEEFEAEGIQVDIDNYTGNIVEYLDIITTQLEVRRRFRTFLTSFTDSDHTQPLYMERINQMCSENKCSLTVGYVHLTMEEPTLAIWLCEQPDRIIELFNDAVMDVVTTAFPKYNEVCPQVFVRFVDVPGIQSIRDLREKHLHSLLCVTGVVVRRSSIFPQLKQLHFTCIRCQENIGPLMQTGVKEVKPNRCVSCHSTGPFKLNINETVFRNYQRITLQEPPGSVPAGRIPRQKEVVLLHDLVDTCSPGEEVSVIGTYHYAPAQRVNANSGFPIFSTVVIANNLIRRNEVLTSVEHNDEDIRLIHQLSRKPNINQLIINSIAPSIYGHKQIKTAVAMSLFGGEAKEFENKHRLRGDINVLILGDPGTAKSQILKYVEKIAPRAVYTTGKGASAVGLTACVRLDPMTKEWTLEGGAMVLADNGTCLIDEFDKMSDQDRTSIHEAMEQQSISISKAGIICTLKARCGVIAAANPISGKYNVTKAFQEQVDLTEPILSRFDCLCVVKDVVDKKNDEMLATFVVNSHCNSHPSIKGVTNYNANPTSNALVMTNEQRLQELQQLEEKNQIPQDILRKYIAYARKHCHPKLHGIDKEKILHLYVDLRKAANSNGGIQITPRHIESLIRMSEAHAKMALREYVTTEDVDVAIRTMLESFISSQKLSVKSAMEKQFQRYITASVDRFELLLDLLRQTVNTGVMLRQATYRWDLVQARAVPLEIKVDEFIQQAATHGVSDVLPLFQSETFRNEGYTYDPERKLIICNLS